MAAELDQHSQQDALDIEVIIHDLHKIVIQSAPHLLSLFQVFAQEARFGRDWLSPNLNKLQPGAAILEVGSGLMLLSCQLVKEGYLVTAIEPIGEGFSDFHELQKIVLNYAEDHDIAPKYLRIPVEEFFQENAFDFAFSINVMEHIQNISMALMNISKAIRPGGKYRFTCPNYLFPYEPHFNLPTFFSKFLTEIILGRLIFNSKRVADPRGLWNSLNWITVPKVLRMTLPLPDISVYFDRKMFPNTLIRLINDKEFSKRRSRWLIRIVKLMVRLECHRIAHFMPEHIQPIMDCTLLKH